MNRISRLWVNLFDGWFQLRRRFSPELLEAMTQAIATGERGHQGEVRFAIESRLHPLAVLEGADATARARQVFSQLGVWDTEHNTGVLFYLLLAEHRIEIVADRGIAARVTPAAWEAIGLHMREGYAQGQWRQASLDGIASAHALLQQHFPTNGDEPRDELPDRPVLL